MAELSGVEQDQGVLRWPELKTMREIDRESFNSYHALAHQEPGSIHSTLTFTFDVSAPMLASSPSTE
jgi:hypothetical protein